MISFDLTEVAAVRVFLISFVVISFSVLAHTAKAQSISEEKLQAAQRYAEASNFEKLWSESVQGSASTLPTSMQEEFVNNLMTLYPVVQPEVLKIIAKHFTVEEMDAMSEFYSTDIGKSILNKMGPYSRDTSLLVQQVLLQMAQEIATKQQQ